MKWHQRILITLDIIKVDKGDEMTPKDINHTWYHKGRLMKWHQRILITLDIIKVDKGDEMTPKDINHTWYHKGR